MDRVEYLCLLNNSSLITIDFPVCGCWWVIVNRSSPYDWNNYSPLISTAEWTDARNKRRMRGED